jgi:hypothetical protein
MALKGFKRYFVFLVFMFVVLTSFGQNVPFGVFYQAVARDNFGKELVNKDIDVKFSIISGNPLGTVVYQELHSKVSTSKFGVFTVIIGHGTPTGGTYGELSQIQWGTAFHYLKIEVKFDNSFIDMGTMQFLAVPYALYAQKSLEPGPAGPKGDPGPKGEAGDASTDNQTISFDQNNLTISGGNSVPLTSLLQNLTITNSPEGNYLGISRGNSVLLSSAEADGDPTNEIQDLTISSDKLKITKNPLATVWDLTKYLDNTDNQGLTWTPATRKLGISGNAGTIDLTELKNDADADPANELQNLSYNQSTNTLTISSGNSVVIGSMVAFRAQKAIATSAPLPLSNIDFISDQVEYNDGAGLNTSTGEFTAPSTGIYTFDVKYTDPNDGGAGRRLMLFKNGNLYEYLESAISVNSTLSRSLTIKLNTSDKIKVVVYTGTGTGIGTGTFSGYKVY